MGIIGAMSKNCNEKHTVADGKQDSVEITQLIQKPENWLWQNEIIVLVLLMKVKKNNGDEPNHEVMT